MCLLLAPAAARGVALCQSRFNPCWVEFGWGRPPEADLGLSWGHSRAAVSLQLQRCSLKGLSEAILQLAGPRTATHMQCTHDPRKSAVIYVVQVNSSLPTQQQQQSARTSRGQTLSAS
jgi:hypothetical protein